MNGVDSGEREREIINLTGSDVELDKMTISFTILCDPKSMLCYFYSQLFLVFAKSEHPPFTL